MHYQKIHLLEEHIMHLIINTETSFRVSFVFIIMHITTKMCIIQTCEPFEHATQEFHATLYIISRCVIKCIHLKRFYLRNFSYFPVKGIKLVTT